MWSDFLAKMIKYLGVYSVYHNRNLLMPRYSRTIYLQICTLINWNICISCNHHCNRHYHRIFWSAGDIQLPFITIVIIMIIAIITIIVTKFVINAANEIITTTITTTITIVRMTNMINTMIIITPWSSLTWSSWSSPFSQILSQSLSSVTWSLRSGNDNDTVIGSRCPCSLTCGTCGGIRPTLTYY